VRTIFCGKLNSFQLFVISSFIAIPFGGGIFADPRWICPRGIPPPPELFEVEDPPKSARWVAYVRFVNDLDEGLLEIMKRPLRRGELEKRYA